MTQGEQISEMHSDIKSVLNERLPAIEQRLTKIETRHSVWGAVAGFLGGVIAALLSGLGIAVVRGK